MLRPVFFALATTITLLGCGDEVSVEPSGGSGGGSAQTSSTDATTATSTSGSGSGGGGGESAVACPSSEPAALSACAMDELRCTYGDSVSPECRRGYRCQGGQWQPDGLGCEPDLPACDTDFPVGISCDVQQAQCIAITSLCVCGPCGGAGCPPPPWSWSCGDVSGDPACPKVIPNDGTTCDAEGSQCHYGVYCSGDRSIQCLGGTWVWDGPMACP